MMDRVVANFSGKTYIFKINVLSIGLDTNDHQHLTRLLKSTISDILLSRRVPSRTH